MALDEKKRAYGNDLLLASAMVAAGIVMSGVALMELSTHSPHMAQATQPLARTETSSKFDVRVNVQGGGPSGQAGAVRHGIARALLQVDGNLRPTLKADGFLTRDPRMRERKKYGQPGARKRFQYSKR